MQLTIDSNEPLDHVLRVVGSLYGVNLVVADQSGQGPAEPAALPEDTPSQPRASRPRGAKKAASKTPPRSGRTADGGSKPDLTAVRQWARDNGYAVSDRGRVPNSVLAAYDNNVTHSVG